MRKISFKNQVLPHLIAIAVFLIISVAFYHPLIFEGKTLNQNDILQGKGAVTEMAEYRDQTGEEALWTSTMFSGMPTYLLSVRWSGDQFLRAAQNALTLYLPIIVRENFLAFLCFYILLLAFGVRPSLAIAGALAFGLSSFYVISIGAGHMWKVRAIALMALVLAGVHTFFNKNKLWGFILTALALAMQVQANHLQVTYYLLILLVIYWITQLIYAIKEGKTASFLKFTIVLGFVAVLAVAINIGRIWTTLEYGKYSIRGKSELATTAGPTSEGLDRDYAFRWSSGKWETLTMLVPNIYGGGSGIYGGDKSEVARVMRQNNVPGNQIANYEKGLLGYWGDQPGTAGPVYIGAIVCFLFVLAFFTLEKKHLYWMVIASAFAIMLTWGKNFQWFNYMMFDYFPGYNKFRAVTMAVVIPSLLMPLMGFVGLEQFLQLKWSPELRKKLWLSVAITGGLAMLIALFANPPQLQGDQIPGWLASAVEADRKSIIRLDVMRSLFFIAATFALLLLLKREKISEMFVAVGLTILVTLDLGMADWRYIKDIFIEKRESTFLEKTEADELILQDQDVHYRVFNLQSPYTEGRTSIFHSSIGGYHGAKIRRYQDLVERHLEPERLQIIEDKGIRAQNSKVLSMLNTKYMLAGTARNGVIRNPFALGNAWFVADVTLVDNPDEEINALDEIDPATVAVIDRSKFGEITTGYDSTARITLVEHQPNYLKYESSTQNAGLAVFSEIYYPKGWQATIDGEDAPILRADYVLRAMQIPSGSHVIEFRFAPDSYIVGNKITFFTMFVYLALLAFGAFALVRESK